VRHLEGCGEIVGMSGFRSYCLGHRSASGRMVTPNNQALAVWCSLRQATLVKLHHLLGNTVSPIISLNRHVNTCPVRNWQEHSHWLMATEESSSLRS
jgi:hypothetical protein